MLMIAWDNDLRVAWILSPGADGMGVAALAGASLLSSSFFTVGSVRKDFRCGVMSDFLAFGLYSFIQVRSDANVPFGLKTVGIFDMVAVRVKHLSQSLTYPSLLQLPTHISMRIDCAHKRFRI
jgi:hypothetical protein